MDLVKGSEQPERAPFFLNSGQMGQIVGSVLDMLISFWGVPDEERSALLAVCTLHQIMNSIG